MNVAAAAMTELAGRPPDEDHDADMDANELDKVKIQGRSRVRRRGGSIPGEQRGEGRVDGPDRRVKIDRKAHVRTAFQICEHETKSPPPPRRGGGEFPRPDDVCFSEFGDETC